MRKFIKLQKLNEKELKGYTFKTEINGKFKVFKDEKHIANGELNFFKKHTISIYSVSYGENNYLWIFRYKKSK